MCSRKWAVPFVLSVSYLLPASIHTPREAVWRERWDSVATRRPLGRTVIFVRGVESTEEWSKVVGMAELWRVKRSSETASAEEEKELDCRGRWWYWRRRRRFFCVCRRNPKANAIAGSVCVCSTEYSENERDEEEEEEEEERHFIHSFGFTPAFVLSGQKPFVALLAPKKKMQERERERERESMWKEDHLLTIIITYIIYVCMKGEARVGIDRNPLICVCLCRCRCLCMHTLSVAYTYIYVCLCLCLC